jgi:hypothetical protein
VSAPPGRRSGPHREEGAAETRFATAVVSMLDADGDDDHQASYPAIYRPRAPKRHRSTKAEMVAFRSALVDLIEEVGPPVTVRQVYYLAVAHNVVPKTESSYRRVTTALADMRESGDLAWSAIADNTRWVRQQTCWDDVEDFLGDITRMYRRDTWRDQPFRVEVWVESDSIAGFVSEITYPLGVPLFVCKGQSSKAYIRDAATISDQLGKPIRVMYLGDYDPTGLRITTSVDDRYRRYAPSAELTVERIAVTPEQIDQLELVGHPSKRTDPNYPWFAARCAEHGTPASDGTYLSYETEAIPPPQLRAMVRAAVESLMDPHVHAMHQIAERDERNWLVNQFGGAS